jgi:eukaryotic-like serine/threonine-protein kinase
MPDMNKLRAGDTARLQSSGEIVHVGERLAEGGQGAVYLAELNGQQFALKWYEPLRNTRMAEQFAANITKLITRGKPQHRAFIWPIDMVVCPERDGFGYIMPLMDPKFRSFAQLLKAAELPSFWTLIQIGINLVDAFAVLHTTGLCYRDISFGNVYVDPDSGDVAVIDNDNVGPNGGESAVLGTAQFMAPEVIRGEKPPSIESDLYSLAIFLFFLFCFGHPLEGEAVEASYSWEDDQRLTEPEILLKHYGREPIFIFDPVNDANRPLQNAPTRNWWGIYPQFFRNLFIRSFTTGLTDSSLTGRLAEGMWRRGLYRLRDCIWQCGNCAASIFYDPDDVGYRCWSCGTIPPPPLLLVTPGHALVLTTGAILTGRHLKWPAAADQVLAEVEADPRYPGALLRNRTEEIWTVNPVGEETKEVKPGHRLLARPMAIELAGKQAVIRYAPGGEGR